MNLIRKIHDEELGRLRRMERALERLRDCPHQEHFSTRLNEQESKHLLDAFAELIDLPIPAGVRLSGRAATTSPAKTERTRKRCTAKRDDGTAGGRAVEGSTPSPGFSPGMEARAAFRERCAKVKLKNTRYF